MKIEAILNLESYFHKVTARWLVKLNYVHACSSNVLCIFDGDMDRDYRIG